MGTQHTQNLSIDLSALSPSALRLRNQLRQLTARWANLGGATSSDAISFGHCDVRLALRDHTEQLQDFRLNFTSRPVDLPPNFVVVGEPGGDIAILNATGRCLLKAGGRHLFFASEEVGGNFYGGSWSIEDGSPKPLLPELMLVENQILALASKQGDFACLHAAALMVEDCLVLLVGPSGSGKSSLALALWSRGATLIGDDIVFVSTSRRLVASAPRPVSRPAVAHRMLACAKLAGRCLESAQREINTGLTAPFSQLMLILINPERSRCLMPASDAIECVTLLSSHILRNLLEPRDNRISCACHILSCSSVYGLGRYDLTCMSDSIFCRVEELRSFGK